MARISKSDNAPKDDLHISLSAGEFDLKGTSAVYETDDPAIIADARANPFLSVEEEVAGAATAVQAGDPLDPHFNPAADHLSAARSDEAVQAADENEARIKEATGADVTAPTEAPSVADSVEATLRASGVEDDQPAVPQQTAQAREQQVADTRTAAQDTSSKGDSE